MREKEKAILIAGIIIVICFIASGNFLYNFGYDDGICSEHQKSMFFVGSIAEGLTSSINKTVDTIYNESGIFTVPFQSRSEVKGRGPMAHYTFISFDGIESTMISYNHISQYKFRTNLTAWYVINSLGEKVITGVKYLEGDI